MTVIVLSLPRLDDVAEVIEAEIEKPVVVDLSLSVVKATFVELLRLG